MSFIYIRTLWGISDVRMGISLTWWTAGALKVKQSIGKIDTFLCNILYIRLSQNFYVGAMVAVDHRSVLKHAEDIFFFYLRKGNFSNDLMYLEMWKVAPNRAWVETRTHWKLLGLHYLSDFPSVHWYPNSDWKQQNLSLQLTEVVRKTGYAHGNSISRRKQKYFFCHSHILDSAV